jgi:hypothetical protein
LWPHEDKRNQRQREKNRGSYGASHAHEHKPATEGLRSVFLQTGRKRGSLPHR